MKYKKKVNKRSRWKRNGARGEVIGNEKKRGERSIDENG